MLLAHVGDGVEHGAEQDQAVAQDYVIGCGQEDSLSAEERSGKKNELQSRKTLLEVLTGSLVSSCQDVGPHHGPHPQQTHQHGYKMDRPVAALQEEPGQHHQSRDHKTVKQLKESQDRHTQNPLTPSRWAPIIYRSSTKVTWILVMLVNWYAFTTV